MSNNENKTDGDIVATLIGARIPKAYHIKGMSLKDSETGERLMDFLEAGRHRELMDGGIVEIVGTGMEERSSFFMFLRSLIIKNLPAAYMYAEELKPSESNLKIRNYDKGNIINEYRILGIEGMTPDDSDPFGNEIRSVEWMLSNWLENGNSLVLLSDIPIISHPIWSKRFLSLIGSRILSI